MKVRHDFHWSFSLHDKSEVFRTEDGVQISISCLSAPLQEGDERSGSSFVRTFGLFTTGCPRIAGKFTQGWSDFELKVGNLRESWEAGVSHPSNTPSHDLLTELLTIWKRPSVERFPLFLHILSVWYMAIRTPVLICSSRSTLQRGMLLLARASLHQACSNR